MLTQFVYDILNCIDRAEIHITFPPISFRSSSWPSALRTHPRRPVERSHRSVAPSSSPSLGTFLVCLCFTEARIFGFRKSKTFSHFPHIFRLRPNKKPFRSLSLSRRDETTSLTRREGVSLIQGSWHGGFYDLNEFFTTDKTNSEFRICAALSTQGSILRWDNPVCRPLHGYFISNSFIILLYFLQNTSHRLMCQLHLTLI